MNSVELTRLFRDLPTSFTDSPRRLKSLIVAQVLAYSITLEPEKTLDEHYSVSLVGVKAFIQELNETTLVDVPLTLNLYKRLLDARLDAVMNPTNPTLMNSILQSDEQSLRLNDDTRAILNQLLSTDVQSVIHSLIRQPEGE